MLLRKLRKLCCTLCKTRIYSLLRAKCIDLSLLIDYGTRYFKDVMRYYYCQFSPVSALQRLLTIEISQIQFISVSAEQRFVIKGNIRRYFRDPAQCPLSPLNRDFTVLKYCWFSVSRHSKQIKIKIKTVQQIKSRIWEMKGGKYAKTLAKIQVRGVFRIQDIRRNVLPRFIEICMGTPCWCSTRMSTNMAGGNRINCLDGKIS